MSDFFVWFLQKHWLIAAFLFPELSLVWATWQRETVLAIFLALYVVISRVIAAISALRSE